MIRTTWMGGAIVAMIALASCGTGTPTVSSPAPSPSQTQPPSPSSSPSPLPSQSPLPAAIVEALTTIEARVSVPVMVPTDLPADIRLASNHSVSFSKNGKGKTVGTLSLELPGGGVLMIDFGPVRLAAECEGSHVRKSHVGPYPALVATTSDHAAVLWPATSRKPQGQYQLRGSLPGDELLRLARSMQPVRGLQPTQPPPAC